MQNNTERSYHHGDLRRALVDAALAYIQEGNATFTLRNVARRAGVSHAAPYNHFKDKQELLSEVAAVGFENLYNALENIDTAAANPRDLFLMRWKVFLNFALLHPEHYGLMLGPVTVHSEYPRLIQAREAFYNVLIKDLEQLAEKGLFSPERIASHAIIISSQLHGLSMLAIHGRLKWYNEDLDKLAKDAIDVLLRGMKVIT